MKSQSQFQSQCGGVATLLFLILLSLPVGKSDLRAAVGGRTLLWNTTQQSPLHTYIHTSSIPLAKSNLDLGCNWPENRRNGYCLLRLRPLASGPVYNARTTVSPPSASPEFLSPAKSPPAPSATSRASVPSASASTPSLALHPSLSL
ncbi:hypothetical protein CsSME_00043925 [Camellia sinensis var. sinensis]